MLQLLSLCGLCLLLAREIILVDAVGVVESGGMPEVWHENAVPIFAGSGALS